MTKHICILTSVHPPFDTRIFHRQAKTLSRAGYAVTVMAQHNRDEVVEGIAIIAIPPSNNRLQRMLGTWRIFRLSLKQKADAYHFHDPELLPAGLLLKWFGRAKVIYDVHEDVPKDIRAKKWIIPVFRVPISVLFSIFEKAASTQLDHIVTATDDIGLRFSGNKTTTINNYPIVTTMPAKRPAASDHFLSVMAGSLSGDYGIINLVEAVKSVNAKHSLELRLIGKFQDDAFENRLRKLVAGCNNMQIMPWLPQKEVFDMFAEADIGVIVYQPVPNNINSQPNKLFEYMMFSLPVVASDFPLWKRIVEGNGCGVTVDPTDPVKIAQAIEYILENPEIAGRWGENGRKAVLEKYNWDNESVKLLHVYRGLLNEKSD